MAAVQASRPEVGCSRCEHPTCSENFIDRHVCPSCGKPRAVAGDENFFSALGAPEKFKQNPSELQSRFYQISRALHPDRFGTADAVSRQCSLERMSFVNEAYATLRDPVALREYILKLHGFKSDAKGQVPVALAELWFELQDDLSEENVTRFRGELKNEEESLQARVQVLQQELDAGGAEVRKGLEELAQLVQQGNYLKSMRRDLENRIGGMK